MMDMVLVTDPVELKALGSTPLHKLLPFDLCTTVCVNRVGMWLGCSQLLTVVWLSGIGTWACR